MIPDCTLTTCCFNLTKFNNQSRNVEDTIKNMKALLEVPCYLVIFTDISLVGEIAKIRNDQNDMNQLTYFYVCKPEVYLESFKYVDQVKQNREKYHPTKDERTCAESHLVCCSKFELVLKTMKLNPFNTSKFGWIDANVGVNFSKICTNYQNHMLLNILHHCSPDKFHLQILNVCDKKFVDNDELLHEYYSCYRWIVCGCLFVTGKSVGESILNELNNVFVKHTLGFDYLFQLVKLYNSFGYWRESVDCCDKVLHSFDHCLSEINYKLFFQFLLHRYVALYYVDIAAAKCAAEDLMTRVNQHPLLFQEYNKNKPFYDDQLKYVLHLQG